MQKGTCLISYVPLRSEPRSGAEMVSSILFGESYSIIDTNEDWIKIKMDVDGYEGWMSIGSYAEFRDYQNVSDALILEASSAFQKLLIPCGAQLPNEDTFEIDGAQYTIIKKLKTSHHLPLKLRLLKTVQNFLNTPYLWGGRSFMGIDCSGLMQVTFKANGINISRDTSQQINEGAAVEFGQHQACDLVFFSKPGKTNVSHVGMVIDEKTVIHSSSKVQLSELTKEGLIMHGELAYSTICIKRILA